MYVIIHTCIQLTTFPLWNIQKQHFFLLLIHALNRSVPNSLKLLSSDIPPVLCPCVWCLYGESTVNKPALQMQTSPDCKNLIQLVKAWVRNSKVQTPHKLANSGRKNPSFFCVICKVVLFMRHSLCFNFTVFY